MTNRQHFGFQRYCSCRLDFILSLFHHRKYQWFAAWRIQSKDIDDWSAQFWSLALEELFSCSGLHPNLLTRRMDVALFLKLLQGQRPAFWLDYGSRGRPWDFWLLLKCFLVVSEARSWCCWKARLCSRRSMAALPLASHKVRLQEGTSRQIFHDQFFSTFQEPNMQLNHRKTWHPCWLPARLLLIDQNQLAMRDHHRPRRHCPVSNLCIWYLFCANPRELGVSQRYIVLPYLQ